MNLKGLCGNYFWKKSKKGDAWKMKLCSTFNEKFKFDVQVYVWIENMLSKKKSEKNCKLKKEIWGIVL